MAAPEFSRQSPTIATETHTDITSNLRFDSTYLYSLPGKLKIIQIVFILLSFFAMSFSTHTWYQNSTIALISMFGFWFSLFMLVFYIFHVVELLFNVPWLKIEMIFDACWPIIYFLSAIGAVADTGLYFTFMISWFFGFVAMIAYAYDALLIHRAIQFGKTAEGSLTVTTTTY